MFKFVIILILALLYGCSSPEKVNYYEKAYVQSQEPSNLEVGKKFESYESVIYADINEFCCANNVKPKQFIPFMVWRVSASTMRGLYLENSTPDFDINQMVSFCWQDRFIIVLSRNNKEDFYHEFGHAIFGNNEQLAEAFRVWCVKKDYIK